MNEWRSCLVGDLCDAGLAELQTGPFGSQLHAYDYVDDGVDVVPTEAIRDRMINHEVLPKITSGKAEELKRHRLRKGDILFARRGVQATGHIAFVRDHEDGFICGTGAIRLRVVEGDREVLAEYLSHVFANPASVSWFKFHAIGATMPNLNEGIIRRFPLHVPPLSYQEQVTELLSALDDKFELNRRMNETLEAMARAIFKDWFVDFGPTRAKAKGRAPYLAPDLWNLFPDTLDDEDKPVGWDTRPLKNFFSIVGGGTPKTSVEEYWGGEIPWFSVVDTPPKGSVFVIETDKSITERGLQESSARLVPEGTTIISARGTVGNLAIAGQEMTFNQSCYALHRNETTGNFFVYLAAGHMVAQLQAIAHGSVFSTITRQTFEAISLAMPSQPTLHAFEDVVAPLFLRIKSNVIESSTLAQTRDLLLPKLMSGEIRLREAEKAVEAVA